MGRRPVAAALLCAAASALPALRPRKNTIACADPLAAQDFTLKYVGGLWTDQLVDGGNGSCANIKWVNFSPDDPHNANNTQFHWHFVETSRKPTGPMSLVQLHGYQEWLHGNLSEAANPADELADMHMTLAAGSLDPFAELYRRDGVPFSPRARFIPAENLTLYSVLVEIPHGILVEIVSDTFASYDGPTVASGADDCAPRKIPTANAAYFARLRTIEPYGAESLPPVWPYSMSYASTTPAEAAAFVERHMGGRVVDQELPPACGAEIAIGLNHFVGSDPYPFYIQWLHHPRAKRGYMDLAGIEAYLEALHGNLTEDNYDQYMDDHLGMLGKRGPAASPFVPSVARPRAALAGARSRCRRSSTPRSTPSRARTSSCAGPSSPSCPATRASRTASSTRSSAARARSSGSSTPSTTTSTSTATTSARLTSPSSPYARTSGLNVLLALFGEVRLKLVSIDALMITPAGPDEEHVNE